MHEKLSRREREIMDILLMQGEASAGDVQRRLNDAPSYSTVRVILTRLENKGHVRHKERGLKYVYSPVVTQARARKSAIDRLVKVFYEGSVSKALTGLVDASVDSLSAGELEEIERAIADARRKSRKRGA